MTVLTVLVAGLAFSLLTAIGIGKYLKHLDQETPMTDSRCDWCGHPAQAHQHYRPGSDCGTCGHHTCPRYRTPRRWWQIWRTR